jgi:type IV secretory pathway VirB10-like protein
MRPKIVILILVAGLAGVTGILLIKHRVSPPPAAAPIAITETKPAAPQTAPTITSVPPTAPAPLAAAPVAMTPEQRQAAIDAETDHLQQWSMNDDPESLSNILADLTNSEKDVRKAAIEAAEQFGSTNAIPILKNLAANDGDPEEKAALLEAAHFLSLPSIFDVGK